jgi:Patatin-like phospholipase
LHVNAGALQFRAGPAAYADIKKRGFAIERIGTLAGASGGAKWLVLSQLDRVLVERVLPALAGPVHLVGSSIGAWRFACYAQAEPLAAIERFERAYLEQSYSEKPDSDEITRKSEAILDEMLGRNGAAEAVAHPQCRLHIMTVLCGRLTASDRRWRLASGLLLAAAANLVSRPALGRFFTRALFFDQRDLPPFYNAGGFPLAHVPLTAANLSKAVLASGAIPLVLNGVRDIPGAPAGTYRDGGVIDYHLDLPLSDPDRLTLFPHFFGRLVPGWFDKRLPYRRHSHEALDRTVLMCPSPEFIARLPHGKVPDRHDFVNFPPAERERNWRTVVAACRELADDLQDVLEHDRLAARLQVM